MFALLDLGPSAAFVALSLSLLRKQFRAPRNGIALRGRGRRGTRRRSGQGGRAVLLLETPQFGGNAPVIEVTFPKGHRPQVSAIATHRTRKEPKKPNRVMKNKAQ